MHVPIYPRAGTAGAASALVLILALLATGTVLLLWPETALTLLLRALGVLALTGAALLLGGFLARG